MKTRVITSVVALIILAAVMLLFNTFWFNLIICAVCLLSIHEVYMAFGFGKREWYLFIPFVPFTLVIMLSTFPRAWELLLPVSFVFALYLCICVIWHNQTLSFAKLGGMVCFSGLILLCFYSLIYLKRLLPIERYQYDALYFILLILCFAWGGDSMAYFAGRFWGKHKLAPVVSPNKTVEGAIGGVCGSVAMGLLATAIYEMLGGAAEGLFSVEMVSGKLYFFIALLAVGGSILGILGDLFASAVKRQCKIKDYGKIFPGHGGMLDRFDSVMFIAPFVSMIVTLVFYRFVY